MISKGLEAYGLSIHASDDKVYWAKDGDLDLVVSTIAITDTTWHHICATKDGTGAGSIKLYIDGVDRTSVLFDDQVMINTANVLALGKSTLGGSVCDSYLDELAVYPTALSAERVLAHYNAAFTTGRTYKRLTGPAQLTGSAADLYTCPASTVARVLHIHASNPSGAEVDVNLSIGADAAATRIFDDRPIPADGVLREHYPYELAAGEKIQGWASTAGTVVLTVTGYEDPV